MGLVITAFSAGFVADIFIQGRENDFRAGNYFGGRFPDALFASVRADDLFFHLGQRLQFDMRLVLGPGACHHNQNGCDDGDDQMFSVHMMSPFAAVGTV